MTNSYNTKEGIASFLGSVKGLRALWHERHAAGHERKERLAEFCVLGRFYLDQCGNFYVLTRNAPADVWTKSAATAGACPNVLTREELSLVCRGDHWGGELRDPLPPVNAVCDSCGRGWVLSDCHEFVLNSDKVEHLGCYKRRCAAEQRAEFEACFRSAGFPRVNLVTIPNEYWGSDYYALPWYLAQVDDGRHFQDRVAQARHIN